MLNQHSRIVHHLSGPFDFQARRRRPYNGNVLRTERFTCSICQDFDEDDHVDDASSLEEDWEGRQDSKTCQTDVTEWVDGDEVNKQDEVDKYGLKGANDSNGNVHLGKEFIRRGVHQSDHRLKVQRTDRGHGSSGDNMEWICKMPISDCVRSAACSWVLSSLQVVRKSLHPP
jgi:hypothetical protein